MKIIDYMSSLLSMFKKDDVLEDLRLTSEELKNTVIPLYIEATKSLSTHQFKSPAVMGLFNQFKRSADRHITIRRNLVDTIAGTLGGVAKTGAYIQEMLDQSLSETNINEGLTARKAVLVRGAEQYSFLSTYALKLLNYILLEEMNVSVSDIESLSEAQVKALKMEFSSFMQCLNVLTVSNFKDKVEKIPNIVLTANSMAGVAAFKPADVDPFEGSSFINGFTGNPIYHFRLIAAQWQANRYHALKDRKKLVEMRLLYLRNNAHGRSDAAVEKQINKMQERVNTLEYNIRKMEEGAR